MNIVQSTGNISLASIRMLIYGNPKLGKTTFVSGWPNLLLLATEKGYGALKLNVQDIESWEHFKEISKELREKKKLSKQYKTIAIDTIDILANLCIEYICGELEIDHISEEKWAKGYDRLKKEFGAEMNKLCMTNYGIIFISHTKIMELSSIGRSISKTIPTLNNQARAILIPLVDIIGCMRIKTIKNLEGKYKDVRMITFKPSELWEAGDRTGQLPDELRVYKDSLKTYKKFEEAYEKGRNQKGGSME